MLLRPYNETDAETIVQLFTETVHAACAADYDSDQLEAWAPRDYSLEIWRKRLARTRPLVAELQGQIAGFCELEPNGHIGCFYIHKDYLGRGVGRVIYAEIERQARAQGLRRLFVEVSLTARSFFLRMGFSLIARQTVAMRGQLLTNLRMEKFLD
jgi:putative acetyltransferase